MFKNLDVLKNKENKEFVELINKMWVTPNQEEEHTDRGIAFCKMLLILHKLYAPTICNEDYDNAEHVARLTKCAEVCRAFCYGKDLMDGKTFGDYIVAVWGCEMSLGLKDRTLDGLGVEIDYKKIEKDFDAEIYSALLDFLSNI